MGDLVLGLAEETMSGHRWHQQGSGKVAICYLCFFQQRLELTENYSPEVSDYKVLFFFPPLIHLQNS